MQRKDFKRIKVSVALIVAAMSALLPAYAKSVDWSAHFNSEDYWSNHVIYLARITDIQNPSAGRYVTSFHPTKIISGFAEATNRSIQSYPGDTLGNTGEQPTGFPVMVLIGSEILVSESTSYHQTTVVRVMQYPEDQALLVVLKRIAAVRKAPTLVALLAGAASEFELETEYCVNRMLTLPDATISSAELKQLQTLADDSERPADLRIGAEQAALKFSGMPESDRNGAEYHWLREVIERSRQNTNCDLPMYLDPMRRLIYKLFDFEFKANRTESADYILGLIGDQKAPAELREAADSALSGWDQQIFNFQNPDDRFKRMFDTFVGLLQDKNPDLRISGVSSLFDRTLVIMSTQSPPDRAEEYARKAVQALKTAMSTETDSRVMTYFQSRMQIYEERKKLPQLDEPH